MPRVVDKIHGSAARLNGAARRRSSAMREFVADRGYDEDARPALDDAIALDAQALTAGLSIVGANASSPMTLIQIPNHHEPNTGMI
jgi:hypothetical protein